MRKNEESPMKEGPRFGVKMERPAQRRLFYFLVRTGFRLFYKTVGWYEAAGLQNIPPTGPVLLVANHASFLDPPFVAMPLSRAVWFMAKEELVKAPVIGNIIAYLNSFPVRRGTPDRNAIRTALEVLKRGEVLLVFPEGERTKDGSLLPAHLGVAMIALRSRATVIPVAVEGTLRMMPHGTKWLRPGKLKVTYGHPVDLSDLYDRTDGREALQQECADRLMAAIAGLLGVPPPGTFRGDAAVKGAETGKK